MDRQPIQRTIGRRQSRDGRPLTAEDRAAMAFNARYVTRAPKDIFRYRNAEEMNADRQRWILALSRLPDGATRELSVDPDVFAAHQKP